MPWLPRARLAVLGSLILTALACADGPLSKLKEKLKDKLPTVGLYRVSEPVAHENLTIFFLLGEDLIKGRAILTLDEALREKKVILHETNIVNEVHIENVSDAEVFVQAGDIVKGGQQDRTIAADVLIKARSGRVTISSFCVEQGRWAARGAEDVKKFSSSQGVIVGNSLKLAARVSRDQKAVWREIQGAQARLGAALKVEVTDPTSRTSLQLTLEQKGVREAVEAYVKKLEAALPEKGNVVGYAAAINGRVVSADAYASSDLFRRLWPKLLRGSVAEAVSERGAKGKDRPVPKAAVSLFLAATALGKLTERGVLADLKEARREAPGQILFETRLEKGGVVLRRSYIAR